MTDHEQQALNRLITIACGDTGQSRRVAEFLLAWWNATENGGFDLVSLWNVDQGIADDILTVIALIARERRYPDAYGYGADFETLVRTWRPIRKRKGNPQP